MNPELEALLKSWDAFLQAEKGLQAERLHAAYEARLEAVCNRTRVNKAFWTARCNVLTNDGSGPTTPSFPAH